jgi:hypothetical protein
MPVTHFMPHKSPCPCYSHLLVVYCHKDFRYVQLPPANHGNLGKAYSMHGQNLFEGFRSASSREHSTIKMSHFLVGLQLYKVRFLIDGRPLTMI